MLSWGSVLAPGFVSLRPRLPRRDALNLDGLINVWSGASVGKHPSRSINAEPALSFKSVVTLLLFSSTAVVPFKKDPTEVGETVELYLGRGSESLRLFLKVDRRERRKRESLTHKGSLAVDIEEGCGGGEYTVRPSPRPKARGLGGGLELVTYKGFDFHEGTEGVSITPDMSLTPDGVFSTDETSHLADNGLVGGVENCSEPLSLILDHFLSSLVFR